MHKTMNMPSNPVLPSVLAKVMQSEETTLIFGVLKQTLGWFPCNDMHTFKYKLTPSRAWTSELSSKLNSGNLKASPLPDN